MIQSFQKIFKFILNRPGSPTELAGLAISVAFGGSTLGLTFILKQKRKFRIKTMQQPFVQEPQKILRNHQGAKYVLGSPMNIAVS